MKLVIVESPTKARTIGRFLGDGYEIRASMGHVMDLPKSTLAVDVEHNFSPQFEIAKDKEEIITQLQQLASKADGIILATDPDREGEAIAANIAEILKGSKGDKGAKGANTTFDPFVALDTFGTFQRITFHEITKEAIGEALTHPGTINKDLVVAQIARRVLDRLVGYKLSPLLWQKVRRGLSAGRVQSVALRLIVEREKEIEKFTKEKYWTIAAILNEESKASKVSKESNVILSVSEESQSIKRDSSPHPAERSSVQNDKNGVSFELVEINGSKIELSEKLVLYDGEYTVTKTVIDSEEKAQHIVADLVTKQYKVVDIAQKQITRSPQPPFTTSTLQQQAALRFGYSGKRTMTLAQKLYEEGYITYHRTDSLTVAMSSVVSMRSFAKETFGDKYVPERPRFYTKKQKNAQEAHEAIRPTKIHVMQEKVSTDLGRDYAKLYDIIWRRALASQMSDARIESTTVYVGAGNDSDRTQIKLSELVPTTPESDKKNIRQSENADVPMNRAPSESHPDYLFKTSGSVLLFEGFLKVNPFGLEDKKLPEFTKDEILYQEQITPESHETTPPPRYNDASLIKSLEEAGIGRPSTYATIIGTIETRQYIEREQKRFLPTPVGTAVTDFLVKNFSDIDDIPFTAEMENQLDEIANGERDYVHMMQDFYTPFEKKLAVVKKADRVEIPTEKTGEKCPKDNGDLVIRTGRFGKFISCSNFPTCDYKKTYVEQTAYKCPKDGGNIIVRKTRKGRPFYGCSNYPNCDYAAWKLEDVKKGIMPKERKQRKKKEKVSLKKTPTN